MLKGIATLDINVCYPYLHLNY